MYGVKLTARAQRELYKIAGEDSENIIDKLRELGENPRPPGVKKLRSNIYRIRTGNWRIIYAVFDKDRVILVGKIARREKDTYNGMGDLF
jgi:mRNA interferase RelE/StbE